MFRLPPRFAIVMLCCSAVSAESQAFDRHQAGSEAERRAEAIALARGDSAGALDGPARMLTAGVGLRTHWNSLFPSTVEPGAAWTGRGSTTSLLPQASVRWRGLRMQLAPELWSAANRDVRLIPSLIGGNPYADAMRPFAIDLPQQLGEGPVARLDPGNSFVEVSAYGLRVALTSAAARLGAGHSHSILMSPDAPGFPRLELGTAAPIVTPIGDFRVLFGAGQLGQTGVAPDRRTGSRSGAFFEARWRPLRSEVLELGGARFYNRDWRGARLDDLLVPFGSLFFDAQNFGGGSTDNQLLAVYGRVRVPPAGLELWAEFGLNDRQGDIREAVIELEHNSAWLFGLRRAWTVDDAAVWSVEATAASARVPPIQVFRGQATFYEHTPLSQGHTNRGQLLGSRLLERSGGVELRVDRHGAQGRLGLVLGTRDLANQLALVVDETRLRREWSAVAEAWHRDRRGLEWFARLGAIADLNRFANGDDAYSAIVGGGVTWRWQR